MCVNMLVSGLAVWRMNQRQDEVPASNTVLAFLDEHYPDERLGKIYPNMFFAPEEK